MIESYLINAGLGCGSKKNFPIELIKNVKLGISDRWYFLTPVKQKGIGLKSVTLNMAFPFLAKLDEVNEKQAIDRIELVKDDYVNDLVRFLRSLKFIVPPDTVDPSIIPFYANETTGERTERKDLPIRVHILNAVVTVKYRHLHLPSVVDPILANLQNEQLTLESKIDTLTIYVAGTDFAELSQTDQDLLTEQLVAMNIYNDRLKTRILNY
jgi:hypothetical protein